MTRRELRAARAGPLLDIASYARPGPGRRDHFSLRELSQIRRTVSRAPEVMVKVMGGSGSKGLAGARTHLRYLDRRGTLEVETDEGRTMKGSDAARQLIDEWNLDLEIVRRRSRLSASDQQTPPRLIHRVVFSMPAGTNANQLAAAVRRFGRSQLRGKHRYAFVVHTDTPHPHAHMVIKGIGEAGQTLEIRKALLRQWRAEFARHLNELGVSANATERAVRGEVRPRIRDRTFRAMRRGDSAQLRAQLAEVVGRLRARQPLSQQGKDTLLRTRAAVTAGWRAVETKLMDEGQQALASAVGQFIARMPPPMTHAEWLARGVLGRLGRPAREDHANQQRNR